MKERSLSSAKFAKIICSKWHITKIHLIKKRNFSNATLVICTNFARNGLLKVNKDSVHEPSRIWMQGLWRQICSKWLVVSLKTLSSWRKEALQMQDLRRMVTKFQRFISWRKEAFPMHYLWSQFCTKWPEKVDRRP